MKEHKCICNSNLELKDHMGRQLIIRRNSLEIINSNESEDFEGINYCPICGKKLSEQVI